MVRLVLIKVFKVSNSIGPRLYIRPNGDCLPSSNLMACSFILMFSKISGAFSAEMTLLWLEYSAGTSVKALSNSRAPTWSCFLEYISISSCSRMVTYITNILLLTSNAAIMNSFGLTIWTCLVVSKALLVV